MVHNTHVLVYNVYTIYIYIIHKDNVHSIWLYHPTPGVSSHSSAVLGVNPPGQVHVHWSTEGFRAGKPSTNKVGAGHLWNLWLRMSCFPRPSSRAGFGSWNGTWLRLYDCRTELKRKRSLR